MADWKNIADQTTKVVRNVRVILRKRAETAGTARISGQYARLADDILQAGEKVEAHVGKLERAHPEVLEHISINVGAAHSLIRRMGRKAKLPAVEEAVNSLKERLAVIAELPHSTQEFSGVEVKRFLASGPATHGPDPGRPGWRKKKPAPQAPLPKRQGSP